MEVDEKWFLELLFEILLQTLQDIPPLFVGKERAKNHYYPLNLVVLLMPSEDVLEEHLRDLVIELLFRSNWFQDHLGPAILLGLSYRLRLEIERRIGLVFLRDNRINLYIVEFLYRREDPVAGFLLILGSVKKVVVLSFVPSCVFELLHLVQELIPRLEGCKSAHRSQYEVFCSGGREVEVARLVDENVQRFLIGFWHRTSVHCIATSRGFPYM